MRSNKSSSTNQNDTAVCYVEKCIVKPRSTMPFLLGGYQPDSTQELSISITPVAAADYEVRVHRDEFDDQTLWCKVRNHSTENMYIEARISGGQHADRSDA